MAQYIVRRLLLLFPTLFVIAVVSFVIIQLPPGDYLTSYIANLAATGEDVNEHEIAALTARYGLDRPLPAQFLRWVWGFVRGDFGQSFQYEKPVRVLIGERLLFTVVISLAAIVFTYVMSIPIGIYSAVRQYSPADHLFTGVGFLGLSIPNFLLALVMLFVLYRNFDIVGIGLFSDEYIEVPWSFGKVVDHRSRRSGQGSLVRIEPDRHQPPLAGIDEMSRRSITYHPSRGDQRPMPPRLKIQDLDARVRGITERLKRKKKGALVGQMDPVEIEIHTFDARLSARHRLRLASIGGNPPESARGQVEHDSVVASPTQEIGCRPENGRQDLP